MSWGNWPNDPSCGERRDQQMQSPDSCLNPVVMDHILQKSRNGSWMELLTAALITKLLVLWTLKMVRSTADKRGSKMWSVHAMD